jgi:hypothetical protein
MFSGSGKESIITINDDYNYINPFIVQDINSNDIITR